MTKRILEKHPENPILTAADFPGAAMYIFNPGVIKYNGEYLMMADVATLAQPIFLHIARSKDGVHFTFDEKPLAWPEPDPIHPEDCIYDPRITKIGKEYFIVYASSSEGRGVRVGIVKTRDFEFFERVSIGSESGNRNGVLFPRKINGMYCRLDRPFGDPRDSAGMWVSYSPDGVFWGLSEPVMDPRVGLWDNGKIGAGAVPIETEHGWLCIYHGTTQTGAGVIYRLGAAMLDRENPAKVLARSEDAILWPEHDYEMFGRVPNVVFSCNAIVEDDGMVRIYYGAADTCVGLAEGHIEDIIESCYSKNPYLLRPKGSPYYLGDAPKAAPVRMEQPSAEPASV
jgi:beta-1,4-mannooligosaccharide/beta-1,4-mannosyl-N-acetylglucosamine phosphorylase